MHDGGEELINVCTRIFVHPVAVLSNDAGAKVPHVEFKREADRRVNFRRRRIVLESLPVDEVSIASEQESIVQHTLSWMHRIGGNRAILSCLVACEPIPQEEHVYAAASSVSERQ